MNIREKASQFSIYLFSQDAHLGAESRTRLVMAGYEVFFFTSLEDVLQRLPQELPHIVILDLESLLRPVQDVVQEILKSSSEIRLFFLTVEENITRLEKYHDYNVDFIFNRSEKSVVQNLLFATDAVCEKLFRFYQNQQLFEKIQTVQSEFSAFQNTVEQERTSSTVRPYQTRIALYRAAESKEQLLNLFYQQTPTQSWIYLKYVPTIQSFLCVSYAEVPEAWVEGLSFKIPARERNFLDEIYMGQMPVSLTKYLCEKLGVTQIKFLPLLVKKNIDGLLVSTQDIRVDIAEDFSLMSLVYAQLVYESQPKYLDVEDPLTGFYNEVFYRKLLDREIDRSKRTMTALSLIKIKIDRLVEVESSYGKPVVDEVIKKVAEQIKLTSRLPDYLCRTAVNEFSLILVNCHRKGAAIRAERLRKTLQAESYTKSGLKITVSQGISEYPTLTNSIEDLDNSARRALDFISEKGGDKICIYKAQDKHKPDFTVNT